MKNEKEIRFIDLFGGIGGFRLGLENANKMVGERDSKRGHSTDIKKRKPWKQPNYKCVWYCDNDKYAVQTYNKNFKENYKPTDITTVETKDIPDFDMLCAGFPCQSFSVAGKRKGFQDIRGTIFFEIYYLALAKKPRLLFLENVKGLLSADDGRCFYTILASLYELGYDVEWQVLNSKNFGVPQNRERVFIIGHLRGNGGRQVFPLGEDDKISIQTYEEPRDVFQSPTSTDYKGVSKQRSNVVMMHNVYGGFKEKEPRVFEECSPTIRTPKGGGHLPMVCSRPHGFNKGGKKENPNVRFSSIQNELVDNIRRLTPVECERLQGFPDNWTGGVSDTQRYKQLGNAVTVNVIEVIGKKILDARN